jgi:hypothetical protein
MVKVKVEQLRNIAIQQLVYSGSWMRTIANTKIELQHVGDGIILLVNDVLQSVQWQVYERRIAGDISHRGGYIPRDKAWVRGWARWSLVPVPSPHGITRRKLSDRHQIRLRRGLYICLLQPPATQNCSGMSADPAHEGVNGHA